MNRYLALSGGLHVLAALFLLLLLAPSAKQKAATYTIDFIGTGKVVATTGQEAPSSPVAVPKAAVQAPAPAQEAVAKPAAKPDKKAYASKSEITTKKQTQKAQPKKAAAPLAAPSVLDDESDGKTAQAGGAGTKEGEFAGGNIQTDFANFPYPWYITQVRNSLWIEWEKRRPAGTKLSALVSFAIARDGKIKDLQIARKSGDDTFDFAATSAVINAGPFAPLPMYYEKDELTVSVEFRQEV